MNILIIGSGGREHAIAWKLRQSARCDKLFVAPGNAGTQLIAINVKIAESDFPAIADFVKEQVIGMVVVGPEAPLAAGIRNYFSSRPEFNDLLFIGPDKHGALLEGSKDFAKQFMIRHHIPTARHMTFTDKEINEAIKYVHSLPLPVVLKADGLAAGKGVIISNDHAESQKTLEKILKDKIFGEAGCKVVIEEFLRGIELSVFVLTDGFDYVILPEAKDYKRIGENDTGPNTGGMGAVSPVKFADTRFMEKVEERIIKPTINGINSEKMDYRGFVFIGLMNVKGDPYVIEYNVRMGDPESQVVFPRLKSDLLELLESAASGKLKNHKVEILKAAAVTVVLASGGYPGDYIKGKEIHGLNEKTEAIIFHAGTRDGGNGNILTNGGRVLACTGKGPDIIAARNHSYNTIRQISWEGMQFRPDIGLDLIKLI